MNLRKAKRMVLAETVEVLHSEQFDTLLYDDEGELRPGPDRDRIGIAKAEFVKELEGRLAHAD